MDTSHIECRYRCRVSRWSAFRDGCVGRDGLVLLRFDSGCRDFGWEIERIKIGSCCDGKLLCCLWFRFSLLTLFCTI